MGQVMCTSQFLICSFLHYLLRFFLMYVAGMNPSNIATPENPTLFQGKVSFSVGSLHVLALDSDGRSHISVSFSLTRI